MAGDNQGLGRLACVGASFRTLGFERLGELVVPQDERATELPALARALGADELVYLATCNRVECWLTLRDGAASALPGQLAAFMSGRGAQVAVSGLTAHSGRDALEHLLRVASALDSLVVGETEIAGQVRRAADEAATHGLLGDALRPVFDRASACARRVRAALDGARPPASAADLAVEKIRQHLCTEGPRACALIGVGPMTRKVAAALRESAGTTELIFVNRTLPRAEELAARFGGRAVALDAFQRDPPAWLDLVFTATSAREHVVRAEHLAPALTARRAAGLERPLIVCDLGVPRDVDPACESLPGALVVALEHMEALAHVRATVDDGLERASGVVSEEVERVLREEKFRAIASESARAMLESRLAHLPAADREAILRFAGGLGERLARQPSSSS